MSICLEESELDRKAEVTYREVNYTLMAKYYFITEK